MIVVNVPAVNKNHAAKAMACQAVLASLAVKGDSMVPTRPIYWFTSVPTTIDDLASEGFPRIGTVVAVRSVTEALRQMLSEVNKFATRHGMAPRDRFRRPVEVFTDNDVADIEAIGCTVIPLSLFGGA